MLKGAKDLAACDALAERDVILRRGQHLHGSDPVGHVREEERGPVEIVNRDLGLGRQHDVPGIAQQVDVHVAEGRDQVPTRGIDLGDPFGDLRGLSGADLQDAVHCDDHRLIR